MDQERSKLSLQELEQERLGLEKDYIAFSEAYDIIRRRIVESLEESRFLELHKWSGTSAVCGSLEITINAIRRTRDEYTELIAKVLDGQIENTDKPKLGVIDGGQE